MSVPSIAEHENILVDFPVEEIEAQLSRLVDSRHFCHSHRYPALLKYLVEQTMAGHARQLKERTLGIEVFHRPADYDTNNDPVVRVTAAEVRKRIAQYYQEPEHRREMRIELPIGTYVPRFARPEESFAPTPSEHGEHPPHAADRAEEGSLPLAADASMPLQTQSASLLHRAGWLGIVSVFCLGLLLMLGFSRALVMYSVWQEHAVRSFWAPVTGTGLPAIIVIGDHTIGSQGNALRANQGSAVNPAENVLQIMNEHEQVTIHDVISLFKITSFLVRHDRGYSLLGAGSASIDDLRNSPVILFAGLDNRWTMRLSEHLRYRFVDSPDDGIGIIADSQNPSRRWQVDFKVPYKNMPVDYAIVARYVDPLIEQPVVIAAGLGENGTVSASDFVTSERFIEDLDRLAPKGWKNGNVEVVLECPVIDGQAAPPHIIASQFW